MVSPDDHGEKGVAGLCKMIRRRTELVSWTIEGNQVFINNSSLSPYREPLAPKKSCYFIQGIASPIVHPATKALIADQHHSGKFAIYPILKLLASYHKILSTESSLLAVDGQFLRLQAVYYRLYHVYSAAHHHAYWVKRDVLAVG